MLKLSKLMGVLILAGFLQLALDAQDVLKGGVAASAARSGEFRTGEQESARIGRGRRFFTGCIAILMAETEPLMQAYSLLVKRRRAALMINDQ